MLRDYLFFFFKKIAFTFSSVLCVCVWWGMHMSAGLPRNSGTGGYGSPIGCSARSAMGATSPDPTTRFPFPATVPWLSLSYLQPSEWWAWPVTVVCVLLRPPYPGEREAGVCHLLSAPRVTNSPWGSHTMWLSSYGNW